MLHVHINHGESDKQSMASNNAKAYDRVFVAGEAAVQRHLDGLMEFDASRLVRIGRPQLDLRPTPLLAPTTRRTVLYAPTWEGDADYNDYTSVDTIGPEVVRHILDVADVRVVYKPHPKVTTSLAPADPGRPPRHPVADRARRSPVEPDAGHTTVLTGNILAVMPDCDAMVTDVSSVGLDWLYLCTDKPILITDRHQDTDSFPRRGAGQPLRRRDRRVERLRPERACSPTRLDHDEHHLARLAMRHFYFDDIQVGDSTTRFLDAVDRARAAARPPAQRQAARRRDHCLSASPGFGDSHPRSAASPAGRGP